MTRSRPTDFYETAGFWFRSVLDVVALAAGIDMTRAAIAFARNAWRERRRRRVYGPLLGQLAIGELEPLKRGPSSNMLLTDERVRELSRDLHELCRRGTTPSRLEDALDVYQELLDRRDAEPTGSHGLLIVQSGLKIRSAPEKASARQRGGAT